MKLTSTEKNINMIKSLFMRLIVLSEISLLI